MRTIRFFCKRNFYRYFVTEPCSMIGLFLSGMGSTVNPGESHCILEVLLKGAGWEEIYRMVGVLTAMGGTFFGNIHKQISKNIAMMLKPNSKKLPVCFPLVFGTGEYHIHSRLKGISSATYFALAGL